MAHQLSTSQLALHPLCHPFRALPPTHPPRRHPPPPCSDNAAAGPGSVQQGRRLEVGVWKTVDAHSKGQMTALAAHPNAPLLATATNNQVGGGGARWQMSTELVAAHGCAAAPRGDVWHGVLLLHASSLCRSLPAPCFTCKPNACPPPSPSAHPLVLRRRW